MSGGRGLFSTAGMRSRSMSADSRAAKRVAVSTGTPITTTSSPSAADNPVTTTAKLAVASGRPRST
jgi:hypothetical protein